jgi:hypothetical protein
LAGLWLFLLPGLLFSQNFQFPITVSDQNGISAVLTIGMNPTGTGSVFAPPPPPSGAFDARLNFGGEDYTKLILVSSTEEKIINMKYQASTGGAPIVLTWNSSWVGQLGILVIEDAFGGAFFSLDMFSANSLNTASNPVIGNQLNIILNATSDLPLPVELLSFTATSGDQKVTLEWSTASETSNLGFEVYKALSEAGEYQLIASYENNEGLEGGGSSNTQRNYIYIDTYVVNNVTYWYKIADVDYGGIRSYHGPVSAVPNSNEIPFSQTDELPEQFTLHPNYPNPFNPQTTIRIELPDLARALEKIELTVYNSLGMRVRTLYDGVLSPGVYEVVWDGKNDLGEDLTSGSYFVHFRAGSFRDSIKILLVR